MCMHPSIYIRFYIESSESSDLIVVSNNVSIVFHLFLDMPFPSLERFTKLTTY